MLVGVPKEIKNHEYRVGLTPPSVRELVARGHAVIVQKNAGSEIGIFDTARDYIDNVLVSKPNEILTADDDLPLD